MPGLTDPGQPRNRRRVLAGVGLFVLGSATVFTLYGAAFGAIGSWLLRWQDPLMRGLGVVVIRPGRRPTAGQFLDSVHGARRRALCCL